PSELMPKRMAVFRELLPSASRLVVIYNPENVSKSPEAARLVELAKELGLDAKAVQFRTAEDIERAFSAFATDRPAGLVVLTEQRSIAHPQLARTDDVHQYTAIFVHGCLQTWRYVQPNMNPFTLVICRSSYAQLTNEGAVLKESRRLQCVNQTLIS